MRVRHYDWSDLNIYSNAPVHVIEKVINLLVQAIRVVQQSIECLCSFSLTGVADIEVKVSAEVIDESIFTTQNHFIVTLTSFKSNEFIRFHTELFLHLLFHFEQRILVNNLNVKLSQHLVRIVRIISAKTIFVIVDFEIGLTQKMVESIALNRCIVAHCLRDVVAKPVLVRLVWLPG